MPRLQFCTQVGRARRVYLKRLRTDSLSSCRFTGKCNISTESGDAATVQQGNVSVNK